MPDSSDSATRATAAFDKWWQTGEQHRFRRSRRPDRWLLAVCVCGRSKWSVIHV